MSLIVVDFERAAEVLDLDRRIRAIPDTAMVRGVFFNLIEADLERRGLARHPLWTSKARPLRSYELYPASELIMMSSTAGALVARISRSSDAYRAGVQPGDDIVAFNGQPVGDPSQLSRMVMDAKIGTTATLTVLRNGRTIDVQVPVVSTARRR